MENMTAPQLYNYVCHNMGKADADLEAMRKALYKAPSTGTAQAYEISRLILRVENLITERAIQERLR
jgi:hypothetical protein